MSLKERLLSTPLKEWKAKQVVVLDWHDGLFEGMCELDNPKCSFYFNIIAERIHKISTEGNLFSLGEIPIGTIDRILDLLAHVENYPPTKPIWIPIWNFSDEAARLEAEHHVQEVISNQIKTNIILQTPDMITFIGYWECTNKRVF